jgi:glycosyltransferase involved in cell wall biosynthesis
MLRVAICQPLIPAYRVPLFDRLGSMHDLELTLYAGSSSGSLRGLDGGSHFSVKRSLVHKLPLDLRAQWAQVRTAFRTSYDLLVIPWDIHYLTLPPSLAIARCLGTRIVLWGHGYSQRPQAVSDAARNACGRAASGVIVYSRTVAEQLITTKGFAPDRTFVAQNALDQTPIQAARRRWLNQPAALAEFQAAHRLDTAKTIVFVSRLEPNNRVDLLIRAMHALSKNHASAKTIIVGDGPERAHLVDLAHSLGLAQNVLFTGSIYEETVLAPWMLSSTLFCYPTNVGLSLLHAFGYGLPVITCDNRGAQNPEIEALIDGRNGLEYREGDLQDMISQCARLFGDATLRSHLSEQALRTVLEKYSMDNMVAGFSRLFDWARRETKPSNHRLGAP